MPDDPANWIGHNIGGGRYRIERKAGDGGMAHVYLAHDSNLDTKVVIKIPRRTLLNEPGFAARFQREIKALVRLAHPHVVRVIDVGRQDDIPFVVMQNLPGGSLKTQRQHNADGTWQPVDPQSLSKWLPQVAKALDFLHQRGFVHRDVKPPNILFDEAGNVYLADFGIIKAIDDANEEFAQALTRTGMALGTAEYMAPEVCMGKGALPSSDQYSLAVTVYEMLSGRYPIQATSPMAVLVQQPIQTPKPLDQVTPGILKETADAVARGLAKRPLERFASCKVFADAIEQSLKSSPATLKPGQQLCPGCNRPLRIPAGFINRSMRCPSCNAQFHVAGEGDEIRLSLKTQPPGAPSPLPPSLPRRPAGQPPALPRENRNSQQFWIVFIGIAVFVFVFILILIIAFAMRNRSSNESEFPHNRDTAASAYKKAHLPPQRPGNRVTH